MKDTAYKIVEQLDKDTLRDFYRHMVRIRVFEERCAEQYMLGNIRGFLHLYIGEEAIAAGTIPALQPQDYITTHYRDHGHALTRGLPSNKIMAELFGKATRVSTGRGGSMHLFDASRNFAGGYAIVAGHMPLTLGLAMTSSYTGKDYIVCCFFGDGAVNEGAFHEVMNMAGLWKLPILFVLENNLYGMGIHVEQSVANPELYRMGEMYNMPSQRIDGMDVLAVHEATNEAIRHVRSGNGPYLLEAMTYRFRGHSMADPSSYRTRDEEAQWHERDPIVAYKNWLLEGKFAIQKDLDKIDQAMETEIEEAVRFADESPWPSLDALHQNIYADS